MILLPVTFVELGSAKAQVLRWLGAACRRPGCDLSVIDLIRLCVNGEAQLILVLENGTPIAAGVTQVREHADRSRSCWILAMGGTGARAWSGTLGQIEAGAARIACRTVEFVGRPGWARLHPGYAVAPCEAGLHFSKELR